MCKLIDYVRQNYIVHGAFYVLTLCGGSRKAHLAKPEWGVKCIYSNVEHPRKEAGW